MKKQLQTLISPVYAALGVIFCMMTGLSFEANAQCSAQQSPQGVQKICEGGSLSMSSRIAGSPSEYKWEWEKDGVIVSTIENVYYATTSGSYRLILTRKSDNCRAVSPNLTVLTVNPLPTAAISLTGPVEICPGGEVEIDAGAHTGFKYEWFRGNAMVGVTATYTVEEGGSYRVRVTDTSGCVDTSDALIVRDAAPPSLSLSFSDTSICDGESLQLDALVSDPDVLFFWQHGRDTVGDIDSASVHIDREGQWSVTVSKQDAIGCDVTSDTIEITIHPLPQPQIVRNEAELEVQQGFASYRWMLDGHAIDGADTHEWTAAVDGDYTVSVTDSNGCSNISAVEHVTLPTSSVAELTAADLWIKLYPNPMRDILHIDASATFRIDISSISGKKLMSFSGERGIHSIALDALPAGVYWYRILNHQGADLHTGKLIRQ